MNSKRLFAGNFLYLIIGELIKGVMQFLYIKHLTGVLGLEKYGVYGYVFNVAAIFFIIVNSGLDVYGLKEVAKNPGKSNQVVSNIISLRLILFLIAISLMSIYIYFTVTSSLMFFLYMTGGLKLLGESLMLHWYFNGKNQIKTVALKSILAYTLVLVFFVAFVKSSEDLHLAILFNSLSFIITAFVLFVIYLNRNKFTFNFNIKILSGIFKKSLPFGISILMVTVYQKTDIEMIKYMTENANYNGGIYQGSVFLINIACLVAVMIQQLMLPILSKSQGSVAKLKHSKYYLDLSLFFGILISTFVFIWRKELVLLQYHVEYLEISTLLGFFFLKILLVYLTMSASSPLIAWGYEKKFMNATLFSAIFNFIGNFIFIPIYGIYGAMFVTIITELLVFLYVFVIQSKHIGTFNLLIIFRYILVGATLFYANTISYNLFDAKIITIFVGLLSSFLLFLLGSSLKFKELKEIFVR